MGELSGEIKHDKNYAMLWKMLVTRLIMVCMVNFLVQSLSKLLLPRRKIGRPVQVGFCLVDHRYHPRLSWKVGRKATSSTNLKRRQQVKTLAETRCNNTRVFYLPRFMS